MLNYTKYLPSWNSLPVVIMTLLSPFSYLFLNPFFSLPFACSSFFIFLFVISVAKESILGLLFKYLLTITIVSVSLAQIYWNINIFNSLLNFSSNCHRMKTISFFFSFFFFFLLKITHCLFKQFSDSVTKNSPSL